MEGTTKYHIQSMYDALSASWGTYAPLVSCRGRWHGGTAEVEIRTWEFSLPSKGRSRGVSSALQGGPIPQMACEIQVMLQESSSIKHHRKRRARHV